MNALIYDCEILRAIPPTKPNKRVPGIEYVEGWHDIQNMGIACICAYDYPTDSYRVFTDGNFGEFTKLVAQREHIIGFNSLSFDDKLCAASMMPVSTTYDLLVEVWRATNQPLAYTPGVTRAGYRLEDLALANLNEGKSGDGATAPVLWQQGRIGQVVDYCLRDVALTRKLFERRSHLVNPADGKELALAPLSETEEEWLGVGSLVSHRSLEPMVELTETGRRTGLLSPPAARQHALLILAAAEAAQADSLVWQLGMKMASNEEDAGKLVAIYRKMRQEIDQLGYMAGEREQEDA